MAATRRRDLAIGRISLGDACDREFARRFRTQPGEPASSVSVGFVFGPRALRGVCGRALPVAVAEGPGIQRFVAHRFRDGAALARFLVRELNRSLQRAAVDARFRVGAVSRLADDESRPFGAHPVRWTEDLLGGRVRTRGGALPVECWASKRAVNCTILLLDWGMDRVRIERGALAGLAPRPAMQGRGGPVFHPVALADLRCALTVHSAAHELGHLLGCSHEDAFNPCAPKARGFAPAHGAPVTVMAAARRDEGGRRLEWSRPAPGGGAWDWGDAGHDEASWLRLAMPQLARQRFRCAGRCSDACRPARAAST